MRRRFAIPLTAGVGILPWLWFYPEPPPTDQPAELLSVLDIDNVGDWNGGLSGIELTPDGATIYLISDRGEIASGTLTRTEERLTSIKDVQARPLVEPFVDARKFPNTDAEGLALESSGRIQVSFEHMHRVLSFDTWTSDPGTPSYTRAWGALSKNGGLEALAVDSAGTLYAIPEKINKGAWEALVYRRKAGGDWTQPFTLPIDAPFAPVGADFGPDGRLYVLERALYPFGFYSRVRAMTVDDTGIGEIKTVLQTSLGTHGNLEGLAVWQDAAGRLRLTMVSDDNYLPLMRGQIVEYVLRDGVARLSE